ncbi:PIGW1 [Auxenochlorella protothecoides x Auxenochlorella symbiontica]
MWRWHDAQPVTREERCAPSRPHQLLSVPTLPLSPGLMDVGVGSFVATSAITRGFRGASRTGDARAVKCSRFRREATRAAMLLLLGLLRLLSTRGVDYQSHASEYGVHWNFFFTLGALRLAVSVAEGLGAGRGLLAPGLVGMGILAAHQYALQRLGWLAWIHAEQRTLGSLLSANKEGLGSLPGYLALHLLSLSLGAGLRRTAANARPLAVGAALALALQAAFLCSAARLQPVSRRACNAPYVAWTLALNAQAVLGFAGGAALADNVLPAALSALSGRMLPVFLAANLATGAVNWGMDTLGAGDWTARAVLAVYASGILLAAQAGWQVGRGAGT